MWPTWHKYLALAISQLGVRESPAGSNKQKYGAAFGSNGQAWCAYFVCWLFLQLHALALIGGVDGYTPTLAKWFHDHHMWSEKPGVGYIPFFAFYGSSYQGRWRGIHHVGACVEFIRKDGTLGTIEGNTSVDSNDNGGIVMRRLRNPANVAGYGVPPWAKEILSPSLTPGDPTYHTKAVMLKAWTAPDHAHPGTNATAHEGGEVTVLRYDKAPGTSTIAWAGHELIIPSSVIRFV